MIEFVLTNWLLCKYGLKFKLVHIKLSELVKSTQYNWSMMLVSLTISCLLIKEISLNFIKFWLGLVILILLISLRLVKSISQIIVLVSSMLIISVSLITTTSWYLVYKLLVGIELNKVFLIILLLILTNQSLFALLLIRKRLGLMIAWMKLPPVV